jgi:hypothetical protein
LKKETLVEYIGNNKKETVIAFVIALFMCGLITLNYVSSAESIKANSMKVNEEKLLHTSGTKVVWHEGWGANRIERTGVIANTTGGRFVPVLETGIADIVFVDYTFLSISQ